MLMIRLIQISNNTNPILINQIINPRMRIGGIAQNQSIAFGWHFRCFYRYEGFAWLVELFDGLGFLFLAFGFACGCLLLGEEGNLEMGGLWFWTGVFWVVGLDFAEHLEFALLF